MQRSAICRHKGCIRLLVPYARWCKESAKSELSHIRRSVFQIKDFIIYFSFPFFYCFIFCLNLSTILILYLCKEVPLLCTLFLEYQSEFMGLKLIVFAFLICHRIVKVRIPCYLYSFEKFISHILLFGR